MKPRLLALIVVFLLITSGCTYYKSLSSSGKDALLQGDFEKAEAIFRDLQEYAPNSFEAYLYLGFISLYRNCPKEAINYFEKSIKLNKKPSLEYLGLGQAHLILKDYQVARGYLEKAQEMEEYSVADYLLGFIYLQAEENSLAKATLNSASKTYPERAEIWATLGKLSLENMQLIDAVQAYQLAYIKGIRTYDIYTGLTEAYYQIGNSRQAVLLTEKALTEMHFSRAEKEQFRLNLARYNIDQNPVVAIESLETIIKHNPNKPEVQLMLGQLYYQQRTYEKALTIFNHYLKHSPPLAQVLYLMYKSHWALENTKLAEKYLLDAIKLKPENSAYYLDLLNLYHAEKLLTETMGVYQRAIELDNDNKELLTNFCGVLLELGEYETALIYIRKAIDLDVKNYDLYLTKAYVHYQLNQLEAEKATYEAILKLAPNHLVALNNLARLLRDTNQLDEAIALYKRALTINSDDSKYERYIGYLLILKNDYLSAREWFERALVKDQNDYQSYRFLGDTYYAKDDFEKAISYYEKSLEINSEYYQALYPLGKAYFFLNRLEEAKEHLTKYLKKFPENSQCQFYLTRVEWLEADQEN